MPCEVVLEYQFNECYQAAEKGIYRVGITIKSNIMYLQNLQLAPLNYSIVKSELLNDIENEPTPTLDEVKESLAEMYQKASQATAQLYYSNLENLTKARNENFSISLTGSSLWQKLRTFLCGFLSPDSTASEIIDKIVEFVVSFIPGGIFISYLVKKLVKYILNLGYAQLCPLS